MQNNTARVLWLILLGNIATVETAPPDAGVSTTDQSTHRTSSARGSKTAALLRRAQEKAGTLRGSLRNLEIVPLSQAREESRKAKQARAIQHRSQLLAQAPTLPDSRQTAALPTFFTMQPAPTASQGESESDYLRLHDMQNPQAPYKFLGPLQPGPGEKYANVPQHIRDAEQAQQKTEPPESEEEPLYGNTPEEILAASRSTEQSATEPEEEEYGNTPAEILAAEANLYNLLSLGFVETATRFDKAMELVEEGARPNTRADKANGNCNTLLHCLVRAGRFDLVERLLKKPGVDISVSNGSGRTALEEARLLRKSEIVALLETEILSSQSHTQE